jgi:hypothetical protein
MSQKKDEEIGRVVRLLAQCEVSTVVRFADELEDSLEFGLYGTLVPRERSPAADADLSRLQDAYELAGSA